MTYPVIVRFPRKIMHDLLKEKCSANNVSISSVLVDLASKYIKGEVEANGRKRSDINKENRRGLDKDIIV